MKFTDCSPSATVRLCPSTRTRPRSSDGAVLFHRLLGLSRPAFPRTFVSRSSTSTLPVISGMRLYVCVHSCLFMKKYSDDCRAFRFEDLGFHFLLILLFELLETLEYFCVDFRLLASFLAFRVTDSEMAFNCFGFICWLCNF